MVRVGCDQLECSETVMLLCDMHSLGMVGIVISLWKLLETSKFVLEKAGKR